MKDTELKCCPFCGSQPRWCGENNPDPSDDHDCHNIICDSCGAFFDVENNVAKSRETLDDLRKVILMVWNERYGSKGQK